MIRLGLRLAGRGGPGAVARLALMAGAIGIGVALVLVLAGGIVGDQRRNDRVGAREQPSVVGDLSGPGRGLLWVPQELRPPGSPTVTSIAVAALADPPEPPGTNGVPEPGTVLVSPELGRRIADGSIAPPTGRVVGTLGRAALDRPDDLVAMTGWKPAALRALAPGAQVVTRFSEPAPFGSASRLFDLPEDWRSVAVGVPFGLLAVSLLLLPVLVLVGAGARIGARRRTARLAALRLAGATPREMRVLTAVEAALAGIAGSVLGLAGALAVRAIAVGQGAFFAADVTLSLPWIAVVLALGPVLAATSAAVATGPVSRAPLGQARELPDRVRARRWWLLAVGWVVFLAGIVASRIGGFDDRVAWTVSSVGFAGVIGGLVDAGPDLVQRIAGGWARHARRPAALLAGRRLQAQPRLGFRAVLAMLLSLFFATVLLVFLPSLDARDADAGNDARIDARQSVGPTLRPDLEVSSSSGGGLSSLGDVVLPAAGNSVALADEIADLAGVRRVLPVVAGAAAPTGRGAVAPSAPTDPAVSSLNPGSVVIATCREFAAVTRTSRASCRPGPLVTPVSDVFTPDPASLVVPLVGRVGERVPLGPAAPFDALADVPGSWALLVPPSSLPATVRESGALLGMYISTDGDPATGRRVAALLASRAPGLDLAPGGRGDSAVSTPDLGAWLLPLLAYVFVLAASALGVVTVDGIFERRRSLAVLRAAGAGPDVLRGAVMLEVAVPLLAVAALAMVNGIAVGIAFTALADAPLRPAWLGLVLAAGLLLGVWLVVTAIALPAVTRASSVRDLRTA